VVEYWSGGVLLFECPHYSTTPSLHSFFAGVVSTLRIGDDRERRMAKSVVPAIVP
jgi:hypothetical protein